jgi:hypothetical protein
MGVKFEVLQMIFEVAKTLNQCIYFLSLTIEIGLKKIITFSLPSLP